MMPSGTTMTNASTASLMELTSAGRMNGATALWYWYEIPKFPCSSPPSQCRYLVSSGWSAPSEWSRACTALLAANGPRTARPGSPGTI